MFFFFNLTNEGEVDTMDEAKAKLIEIFRTKIKGRSPDVTGRNERHDGKYGHWLEQQFGVSSNGYNAPDLWGYELKNETTSKTTFGDWSANEYIYKNSAYSSVFRGYDAVTKRNIFLRIFGKPNIEKNDRYSWSGSPCPKISGYNSFGQILSIEVNGDIVALYSYSQDRRENKDEIVPELLRQENLVLARWYGRVSPSTRETDKCLKAKLEDKFNAKGWFTCKKDMYGRYYKICFGLPMTYDNWLELVRKGVVFFDSGMFETNPRPYSQWRASNNFWDSLIVEEYE